MVVPRGVSANVPLPLAASPSKVSNGDWYWSSLAGMLWNAVSGPYSPLRRRGALWRSWTQSSRLQIPSKLQNNAPLYVEPPELSENVPNLTFYSQAIKDEDEGVVRVVAAAEAL